MIYLFLLFIYVSESARQEPTPNDFPPGMICFMMYYMCYHVWYVLWCVLWYLWSFYDVSKVFMMYHMIHMMCFMIHYVIGWRMVYMPSTQQMGVAGNAWAISDANKISDLKNGKKAKNVIECLRICDDDKSCNVVVW